MREVATAHSHVLDPQHLSTAIRSVARKKGGGSLSLRARETSRPHSRIDGSVSPCRGDCRDRPRRPRRIPDRANARARRAHVARTRPLASTSTCASPPRRDTRHSAPTRSPRVDANTLAGPGLTRCRDMARRVEALAGRGSLRASTSVLPRYLATNIDVWANDTGARPLGASRGPRSGAGDHAIAGAS
jgi:hypothetical protein